MTTVDVWTDPELTELVRRDPALLAIADALTEAAPSSSLHARPSRRRVSYAAIAAVAFLSAAIPAVALSRDLQNLLGLVSNPPVARNWVQATLSSPVPPTARAGDIVVIRWKLWSRNQHDQIVPFDAGGLFARIVNPARSKAITAPARCGNGRHAFLCKDGRFYARVRVPTGGIGSVQVGIMGWSDGPNGRKPAPNLFPITNYP